MQEVRIRGIADRVIHLELVAHLPDPRGVTPVVTLPAVKVRGGDHMGCLMCMMTLEPYGELLLLTSCNPEEGYT